MGGGPGKGATAFISTGTPSGTGLDALLFVFLRERRTYLGITMYVGLVVSAILQCQYGYMCCVQSPQNTISNVNPMYA